MPVGIFESANTATPLDAVSSGRSTTRDTYLETGDVGEAYMVTLAAYSAAVSTTGETVELAAPRVSVYFTVGALPNRLVR